MNNIELPIAPITFVDNINDLSIELPERFRLEAFVCVLTVNGSGSVLADGHRYEIKKNDLFMIHPNIVMEDSYLSANAELRCLVFSPEYMQHLLVISREMAEFGFYFEEHPLLHLTEEVAQKFLSMFDFMRSRVENTEAPHHEQIVEALITAFSYEFADTIMSIIDMPDMTYSNQTNIYRRFVNILAVTTPKRHSVNWYADKLNISPKYFSTICKQKTGFSALQIIDQAVLKDAELLLRTTDMSIKEITLTLGFPNQSFFGSFFRRHKGVSPQAFRES